MMVDWMGSSLLLVATSEEANIFLSSLSGEQRRPIKADKLMLMLIGQGQNVLTEHSPGYGGTPERHLQSADLKMKGADVHEVVEKGVKMLQSVCECGHSVELHPNRGSCMCAFCGCDSYCEVLAEKEGKMAYDASVSGKTDKMTLEEAIEQAKALLEPHCPKHPRIRVWVGFEVEPATFTPCPHLESPEDALDAAHYEDEVAMHRQRREEAIKEHPPIEIEIVGRRKRPDLIIGDE